MNEPKFSEHEKQKIANIYQTGKSLNLTAVGAGKELKKHVSIENVRAILKELDVPTRPTGTQKGKIPYNGGRNPRRARKKN